MWEFFKTVSLPAAAEVLSAVRAFPNPFRPGRGDTVMTFSNLPAGAVIRIYTSSGRLVRELNADAFGLAQWDGANQSGQKVASGVYVGLATVGTSQKKFKVAIQR
jgi:hypothetical protein